MTKLLSSELRWQKKTEEAMRRIGDDSDTGERANLDPLSSSSFEMVHAQFGKPLPSLFSVLCSSESSFSVEDICKQLKTAKNECRKLKGKWVGLT